MSIFSYGQLYGGVRRVVRLTLEPEGYKSVPREYRSLSVAQCKTTEELGMQMRVRPSCIVCPPTVSAEMDARWFTAGWVSKHGGWDGVLVKESVDTMSVWESEESPCTFYFVKNEEFQRLFRKFGFAKQDWICPVIVGFGDGHVTLNDVDVCAGCFPSDGPACFERKRKVDGVFVDPGPFF